MSAGSAQSHVDCSFVCCSSSCALHSLSGPTSLWPTWRTEVGVLIKGECSRGEQESQPGIPLCSMPAPGPVLIQHIMSKLLLAAAPIETLIKAIRGSSWGGAGGWEDVVNSGYVGTSRRGGRDSLKGEHGWGCYVDIGGGEHVFVPRHPLASRSCCLPSFLPLLLSVLLSIPSGGCSVWAWPDCGWFIALQQCGATVVLSCSTSAWGTVRCSAANPLINLVPGTTTVRLGRSQKRGEPRSANTWPTSRWTHSHTRHIQN